MADKTVIKVQKASESASKGHSKAGRLLAQLCYFYPQYTLAEARKLPYKHVKLLLDEAKRMKAQENLDLLQITAAPHTKKGQGYGDLLRRFKKEAK